MRSVISVSLVALSLFLVAGASGSESEKVACRTKSQSDGVTELRLAWESSSAKGLLHHVAPSGNVTDLRVKAEKRNGVIIADDVFETDLVTHAAVVREIDGKKYMRSGDEKQPWLVCE